MSKSGVKILKALEAAQDFTVYPGKQAIRIAGDSVIISVEYYERLKRIEHLDRMSELDDEQLKKLVDLKIKAASKVFRAKIARHIETINGAGVRLRPGFDDVVTEALVAAERVKIDDE